MPATKRTASAAAASSPAKKAKAKIPGLSDVAQALKAADLPQSAVETLLAALPLSLAVVKDERHKYQDEMVESVGAILTERKASLERSIEDATLQATEATSKAESQEAHVATAKGESDARQAAAHEAKVALAAVARGFQAAKKALLEAEQHAARGSRELAGAGKLKEEAEALVKDMERLHEPSKDAIPNFVAALQKHVDLDDSLKTAIPCSFSKEPSTRGHFDHMVISQIGDKLAKRIEELKAKLDNGEADCAARKESVDKARSSLDEKKGEQIASARSYTVAADAFSAAAEKLGGAKKDLASAAKLQKDTAEGVTEAQVNLDLFVQGPLESFEKLRDRVAEKPEAAAEERTELETSPEKVAPVEELKEPERMAASPAAEPVAVA
eukprot:TRINITY_DN1519_c0_g1_i1.p1 TRINITY_DN1519_c0_g1~~TRINITY_DN1519_c0_g1_i1.p1  ORF type:complete len:385 (+),score=166.08 TRINITY_DN1519_c0_g1_i1:62-1216(+)